MHVSPESSKYGRRHERGMYHDVYKRRKVDDLQQIKLADSVSKRPGFRDSETLHLLLWRKR